MSSSDEKIDMSSFFYIILTLIIVLSCLIFFTACEQIPKIFYDVEVVSPEEQNPEIQSPEPPLPPDSPLFLQPKTMILAEKKREDLFVIPLLPQSPIIPEGPTALKENP